jgi:beta-glucuronosyltransferase
MVNSNAPFARKFKSNDPVLDRIDSDLLLREPDMIVPGGWCAGKKLVENDTNSSASDPCLIVGNVTHLQPGLGAERLENLIGSLLSEENFRPRQCK